MKPFVKYFPLLVAAVLVFTALCPCAALAEAPSTGELRILGGDETWISPLTEAFSQLNPDIRLVCQPSSAPDMNQEVYAEAIASGSEDYDIYILYSNEVDLPSLMAHGLTAPLNSEALLANVREMDWDVVDYVTNEQGTLYAYPLFLYAAWRGVRTDLLEENGLGSVPQTYAAYYELLARWYSAESSSALKADGLRFTCGSYPLQTELLELLTAYVHAYTHCDLMPEGQALSFNTPALRQALEQLHPLAASLREDSTNPDSPSLFSAPLDLQHMAEDETLHLMRFSEAETYAPLHGAIVFAVVNPNSQRRADAIRFLEFVMENQSAENAFLMHPFDSYTGEAEAFLATEETYRSLLAQNVCIDCARYMRILIYRVDYMDILSPYLNGTASLEEVLTELDSRMLAELALL